MVGPVSKEEKNDVALLDSLSSCCMKVYKKSLLRDKELYYDEKTVGSGEDLLLNLGVFAKAKSFVYLPNCLYFYRKNRDGSITHTYKNDFLFKWAHLYEVIYRYSSYGNDFLIAFNNRKALSFLSYGLYVFSSNLKPKHKKTIIKESLVGTFYRDAFDTFDPSNLTFIKRLFFNSCKKRKIDLICFMLTIATFLRGRIV